MFVRTKRKIEGFACICDLCGYKSDVLFAVPYIFNSLPSYGWVGKRWVRNKREPRHYKYDKYERYHFCPDCGEKIRGKTKRQILAMIKEKGKQQ